MKSTLWVSVVLVVLGSCQSFEVTGGPGEQITISVTGDDGKTITAKGYEKFLDKAGDHLETLESGTVAFDSWEEIVMNTLDKKSAFAPDNETPPARGGSVDEGAGSPREPGVDEPESQA